MAARRGAGDKNLPNVLLIWFYPSMTTQTGAEFNLFSCPAPSAGGLPDVGPAFPAGKSSRMILRIA
jgi:hypothetical protein